jgi:hypothetical protein
MVSAVQLARPKSAGRSCHLDEKRASQVQSLNAPLIYKSDLIAVHEIPVAGAESGIIYPSRLSRKYQNIMRAREKY